MKSCLQKKLKIIFSDLWLCRYLVKVSLDKVYTCIQRQIYFVFLAISLLEKNCIIFYKCGQITCAYFQQYLPAVVSKKLYIDKASLKEKFRAHSQDSTLLSLTLLINKRRGERGLLFVHRTRLCFTAHVLFLPGFRSWFQTAVRVPRPRFLRHSLENKTRHN